MTEFSYTVKKESNDPILNVEDIIMAKSWLA